MKQQNILDQMKKQLEESIERFKSSFIIFFISLNETLLVFIVNEFI